VSAESLQPTSVRIHARAGLLGNPSDVYGGKALAVCLADWSAVVHLEPSDGLHFDAAPDGRKLLEAALGRLPELPHRRLALSFESDIPRQVGLAGSSAIVVGALRALCQGFGLELHPAELAERALAAETEDLGIVAGPMDRVIQAYGGLVAMDFRGPRGPDSYRRLDPQLLPPLFVAWDPESGEVSGVPHAAVRERWERGEPAVREAMAIFPKLVDEGVACLERGDLDGFRHCVDRNFDTRAAIWPLRERDVEMVRVGRERGAAVKFCGSGGAVVGVLRSPDAYPPLARAYAAAGFRSLVPTVAA